MTRAPARSSPLPAITRPPGATTTRSWTSCPKFLSAGKSVNGPEDWMPPVDECRYLEIWTSIKHRWQLTVDPIEQSAMIRMADGCPDHVLRVPRA